MNSVLPAPLFDAERLRVYPRMMVAAYLVAAIVIVMTATSMIDVFGKPLGYDFITFWAASHLTLGGEAAAAFDLKRIFAAERAAVAANEGVFLWHYPPTYQLLVAPLALLPYAVAFFAFVGASIAAYVLTLRKLLDERVASGSDALFLLIAFPGVFICAFHGQNSLYSAALFAGGLLAMERGRPYLAGLALGLLAYKPQLGLLIPVALIAAREWRVFFSTGAVVLGFAGLATLILGPDLWMVFLKNGSVAREVMETGLLPWNKMLSAFVFLRYLGVPEVFSYALQGLTALGAAACVAIVWWRHGATRLSWAVLISATLLVPPYLFDYELAITGVVLVILASDMAKRGATRIEKISLVALYIAPLVIAPFVEYTHLQIGFPVLLFLLCLSMKRAMSPTESRPSLSSLTPL